MELGFNEEGAACRHKRRSVLGRGGSKGKGGNELTAFESRSLVCLEPCDREGALGQSAGPAGIGVGRCLILSAKGSHGGAWAEE